MLCSMSRKPGTNIPLSGTQTFTRYQFFFTQLPKKKKKKGRTTVTAVMVVELPEEHRSITVFVCGHMVLSDVGEDT